MLTIGLVLGGEFSRYCALDADGKPVEEGTAPSTEAGFGQRFASIPPSVFAVEYRPAARDLYRALAGLGHTLFFSGPLGEGVKAAAAPKAVEISRGAPALVISRHTMHEDDAAALRLAFSIRAGGEIADARYFVGPLCAGADFDALPEPLADARGSVGVRNRDREGAEYELAERLSQLVRSDASCLATVPVLAAA